MVKPTILLNKGEQRLYIKAANEVVESMLCSTGTGIPADGYDCITPNGQYMISEVIKSSKLGWPHPDSPRKPYGPYSCYLETPDGRDTIMGIHGTDEPEKLGQAVTHGCIRVSNEDITRLVKSRQIGKGTLVEIVGGE